jgi:hypothetical protein
LFIAPFCVKFARHIACVPIVAHSPTIRIVQIEDCFCSLICHMKGRYGYKHTILTVSFFKARRKMDKPKQIAFRNKFRKYIVHLGDNTQNRIS